MKNNIWKLALFAGVIALTVLACSTSVTTAHFSDAFMAKDQDGTQKTTVFAGGDTFYAIVDLANAPDDTVVKAIWTAVNVEGEQPDLNIDEASYTSGDAQLYLYLTNQEGLLWPVGQYKVDLYINDKLEKTLEFQVQ